MDCLVVFGGGGLVVLSPAPSAFGGSVSGVPFYDASSCLGDDSLAPAGGAVPSSTPFRGGWFGSLPSEAGDGGTIPGGFSHHTRPAIEPDALLADYVLSIRGRRSTPPPSMVSIHPLSADVSGVDTLLSTIGSDTALSLGDGATASSCVPAGAVDRDHAPASGLMATPRSPATTTSIGVPTDKDAATVKDLIKAITIFHGGAKAATEWPGFWSKINIILRFPHFTPDGPLTTTPLNAANSNRLANLLTLKVGEPILRILERVLKCLHDYARPTPHQKKGTVLAISPVSSS